jgi:hypothetical protein
MSRRPRPELRSIIPSWPKLFESNFLCNDNCPNTVVSVFPNQPIHRPCIFLDSITNPTTFADAEDQSRYFADTDLAEILCDEALIISFSVVVD